MYEPLSHHDAGNDAIPPVSPARPANQPVVILPVAAILLLASLALFVACWLWPNPRSFWGPTVSCALAWMFFLLHVVSARRTIAAFDPALWVPVLMLLHYFGMPVAVMMGFPAPTGYDAWDLGGLPREGQAFATALLTLVAFLAGLHLAGFAPLQRDPDPPPADERSMNAPGTALFLVGFAMIVVGVWIAGANLLFGDYGEMKEAEKFATADLRFYGTGMLFAMGGIYAMLASYRRESPWPARLAIAGSVPILILHVATGDRNGLAVFIMCGGFAITQRARKLPRWIAIAGFAFALVFMPVIKEFRGAKEVSESSRMSVMQLVGATFHEMGSSVQVFGWTLATIPREKPYDLGMSIVSQLFGLIPNFGLTPGRQPLFGGIDHKPSKWITKTANPSKYEHFGGGYAFAIGAEWYFNLGMPGVFFGMLLTGFATGKMRNACRRSAMWLILSTLFMSTMVLIVRNDLGYPARTALWPLVALLVFRFAFGVLGFGRPLRQTEHGKALLQHNE